MSPRKTWLSLTIIAGYMWASASGAAEPVALSGDEFERLHRELLAAEGQPWDSIPWLVSVPEARLLAAKDKKPILTWAQNGHPLGGC